MKIYTKTGDKGETSLVGGQRIAKDDPRIEAYGTIDELNSVVGLVISQLQKHSRIIAGDLTTIQHHLFDIGAELASLSNRKTKAIKIPRVTERKITWLEKRIDRYTKDLAPLQAFILPGGTEAASSLHLARTICRRAERRIVALGRVIEINHELVKYINRLSDYLFTAARLTNHQSGSEDVLWEKER